MGKTSFGEGIIVIMLHKLQPRGRLAQQLTLLTQVTVILLIVAWFGLWLGRGSNMIVGLSLSMTIGLLVAITIWMKPHFGLAVTIASMPLGNLLPKVPFANSMVTLLGGLTLVAYIYHRKGRQLFSYGMRPQLVLSALFIVWQFVMYPEYSYYGVRNWLFTFGQLWVIMWLASELMRPKRHAGMMWLYIIACVISAIYAFSQAQFVSEFSEGAGLVRSEGLAENQNSLAFFLVLGLVFTAYLHRETNKAWASLVYPPIYMAQILGIVGTISRAGFLSLGIAGLLVALFWMGKRQRLYSIIPPMLIMVTAVLYVIPGEYWMLMEKTIFSDEREETGYGNRSALIVAGIEVWKDYPVKGVGIDRFRYYSRDYLAPDEQHLRGKVTHNFYVTLLSETGIIGFLLFAGWIFWAMRDLFLTVMAKDDLYSPLATIWLIAFILFLFRGYTASTMHYDKLLWIMGGISIALYHGMLAYRDRHMLGISEDTVPNV